MKPAVLLALFSFLFMTSVSPAETRLDRFGPTVPVNWQMSPGWAMGPDGARAAGLCNATWSTEVPYPCLLEATIVLPTAAEAVDATTAKFTFAIGTGPEKVQVSAIYSRKQCIAGLTGTGADGKPVAATVTWDTIPSILREQKKPEELTGEAGWSGQPVTLGVALTADGCRLFINGVQATEAAVRLPAERKVSLGAEHLTLRSVQVLPGLAARAHFISGYGVGMLSGGTATRPATAVAPGMPPGAVPETVALTLNGVPMLVQRAANGLAVLDLAAEKYRGASWSEGNGFLRAPVPARPYSAAWLLVYRQPGTRGAMGFGLRVHEMSAGELQNIYLDGRPAWQPANGVTVRPVPTLGAGWYQVRVPLNPAALHWYTHDKDGKLLPVGARTGIEALFCRPWAYNATPYPDGLPSGLAVAALTLQESGIDLTVAGNGLGNVYTEPESPELIATLVNRTERPGSVAVTCELTPFGRPTITRRLQIKLGPWESRPFDALAGAIRARGHYRVRVLADAGTAGIIDYRTNAALLAPDTRKKENSPFGVWSRLWTDNSTPEQEKYLKAKAGVGFFMGKDSYDIRMDTRVPDDATAEALITKVPKEAKILMFGWEHTWSMEQTFALPRLITEGKTEDLPKELTDKMDALAAEWLRLSKAARKLRPDLKISLGNSAVNFTAPLLERGFKPGAEFDYWGTEEGLFDETPEQPADAVGNISWWTRAICEHYGFPAVPVFHSEAVYYASGPGFSRMAERVQAANYARMYLLGFPYNSIYGLTGAMVDSSNSYIYSIWGMAGYCHQAPECSPKLSYVTYATLTQMLDGARYAGRLDTGTTSLYALRFRRPNGDPLYAIWNLRGERQVTVTLTANGMPQLIDALNRPVKANTAHTTWRFTASELPVYLTGDTITSIRAGELVPQPAPGGKLIGSLASADAWVIDTAPDKAFEAPREWRGVPKVMGTFTVAAVPYGKAGQAMTLTLQPLAGVHGLIPRYVSLTAKPGKAIPIPAGTTRLGIWVYGHSTWAQVKLGVRSKEGKTRLLLADDLSSRMTDNFDGWRFVDTGWLGDDEFQRGSWTIDRIVVTMPERQVYVDELITTPRPQIALSGIVALNDPLPAYTYQPW